MASESRHPTTVIVGAGIFGTSTAYHLSKTVPPESITIIDRHPFPWPQADRDNTPYGASHDINKIVRADYSDPFYMQLAQEAIEQWQTLDLIKDFYYRTGWVMLDEEGSDLAERIRSNFKKFGVRDETRDATFDEIRRSWGGLMKDVNTEGFGSAYWNPGAGWAEADRAVEALLCDAVTRGVRYHQGRVSDLCLDENVTNVAAGTMGNGLREIGIDAAKVGAAVSGVKLEDGTLIRGDRIVLATGAWTSSLMSNAESQLGLEGRELVECQVKAAGVVAVHFELSEQEKTEFDQLPVVVYGAYGMRPSALPFAVLALMHRRRNTSSTA
jgi:sarcosine oxidase/L-pipecolate oxidase